MISIKYVDEPLDMGIVVQKNIIWNICETLQIQDNNNIPYIWRFTRVKKVKSIDIMSL